ncbi:MAG: hypothetical protein JOZ57_03395 [Abitibacteriaceae bacterium]|nr:hypothetical protein [Abditibacteriaceae bacterium]
MNSGAQEFKAKASGTRLGRVDLVYCNESYNSAATNERTVEVPLGHDFLDRFPAGTVVEVGAVMPYYGRQEHWVIDLYDSYSGCLREDAVGYDYTGLNVLSISTVEHIGLPDYQMGSGQQLAPMLAFRCLEKMIREANHYLVTFPIGHHKALDQAVQASPYQRAILVRDGFNNWQAHPDPNDFNFAYGSPYPFGNAVCVLSDLEDYFAHA